MTDLHVHTNFCDGLTYPEEYVRAAIKKGVRHLGLLAHSYVPFDSCCLPLERYREFISEIKRLKEKYAGQIDIYCGVEQDLYSPAPTDGFDYVIGSVHYLKQGGRYISVDETPEMLKGMIDEFYSGDFYICAADYFKAVGSLAEMRPDIIGHFDLIKKFKRSVPFDSSDMRYRSTWQAAADRLIRAGAMFEVNTGGIFRGYTDEPYPSSEIAEYIKNKGANLILSSDAHSPKGIAYGFEKYIEYTK